MNLFYLEHKETIHNFIWRSLQVFGKQGITFLIFILCAKLLSPYEFGIYNYALAIIFFLIIFGDFGISTATSKYVAEYNVTDKNKLKSVLFNSGIVILVLTLIITLLTILICPLYLKDKYIYVLYLLPLIFLAPMTSLYDGIYRGLKRFKQLAVISLIIGIISIPMVYFLIKSYGLIGALISQSIFYFVLLIGLGLGYMEFSFKLNKSVMKEIGKYSSILGVENLGMLLQTRIDVLVLGAFGYFLEISYYEVSNKIFLVMSIPFLIFSQIIAPNIVVDFSKSDNKLIKEKIKIYLLTSLILGLILAIITYFAMKMIIPIYLSDYNNPIFYIYLIIFLIIFPIRVAGTILVNSFMVMTGHAKFLAYNNLIFGIINLLTDIALVLLFGAIGILYSTLIISYISGLIIYLWYNKKIN